MTTAAPRHPTPTQARSRLTILLCGADTAAHLQHAVASRDQIGQAKGILIERFGSIPDGPSQAAPDGP